MIDESLLDDPEALTRADLRGLLRAVAASGAQVRTAVRGARDTPLATMEPDGAPNHILVAGSGPAVALAADLFTALSDGALPVSRLSPTGALADPGALLWSLPRWAGPLDLLLLVTPDGSEPGLTELLEQAYRRGCAIVSVSPAETPLTVTATHRRSLAIPLTNAPYQDGAGHPAGPGPYWAPLTPLLLLGDRLGLFPAGPDALHGVADRLDAVAERCGPVARTDGNPAKTLAAELSGRLPLLWSEGCVAGAVARHATTTFTALSGRAALTDVLPEALATHGALLNGNLAPRDDVDDFFRDRVDESRALHARMVLLSDAPSPPGSGTAADAARTLAFEQGIALSELAPSRDDGRLLTVAELIAQLDFAAVYLALA